MPVPYGAIITTTIAAIGAIYSVLKLVQSVRNRNSPQQYSGGATRSSNADESNPVLCQTCHIPQIGDASTWKVFDCGHSYHQRCLSLLGTSNCVECELRA